MCFKDSRNSLYFWLLTRFLTETETWLCQEMFHEPHGMTMFIPALADKKSFNCLKWWHHQWRHECMVHNMHNYTSQTIYPYTIVCAVLFHHIYFWKGCTYLNKTHTLKYVHSTVSRHQRSYRHMELVTDIKTSYVHVGQSWPRSCMVGYIQISKVAIR